MELVIDAKQCWSLKVKGVEVLVVFIKCQVWCTVNRVKWFSWLSEGQASQPQSSLSR